MALTERDREIIRLVGGHRFLRSPQIASLLGESSQQVFRRLQLLYHHGYLERPRAQIDYHHKGGSRPIVYGLGNKGAGVLRREGVLFSRGIRWGEKNRAIGRIFLEHALLVSDVMVALELACREHGHIRLLTEKELSIPGTLARKYPTFRWNVNVSGPMKLGVIPDRVFALEVSEEDGNTNRHFFFLEADRGTMPVTRTTLSQTSFYRKLLAYEATWSQSIHRTRFGFHRFRVLTVTTWNDCSMTTIPILQRKRVSSRSALIVSVCWWVLILLLEWLGCPFSDSSQPRAILRDWCPRLSPLPSIAIAKNCRMLACKRICLARDFDKELVRR